VIQYIVTNPADGTQVVIPSNPESADVGSQPSFTSVDIDGLGGVTTPKGRSPTTFAWSGVLYGGSRTPLTPLFQGEWRPPTDLVSIFDNWVDQQYQTKTPYNLTVTDTNINKDVWISKWQYTPFGGWGDYKYQLEFTEARIATVSIEGEDAGTSGGGVQSDGDKDGSDGGEEPGTPSKYTVQSGDNLSYIAKALYGDSSKWRDIYDANKDTIGPNPDLIQPGMVFTIPGGKASDSDVEVSTDDLDPTTWTQSAPNFGSPVLAQ
jgi:LysM repeat protein